MINHWESTQRCIKDTQGYPVSGGRNFNRKTRKTKDVMKAKLPEMKADE